MVELFGEDNYYFADPIIKSYITRYRMQHDIMLITEDRKLMKGIYGLEEDESQLSPHSILVCKINGSGYLIPVSVEELKPAMKEHSSSSQSPDVLTQVPDDDHFAVTTTIRNVSGNLRPSYVPGAGDDVLAERNGEKRTIQLTEIGPSGAEGTIFSTSVQGMVAKIYKPEKIDKAKFEKLSLMMTKQIDYEGICFPRALLYNQKSEFVGYLMKKAKGQTLARSVFLGKDGLNRNFPNWNKVDTVTLCVTILKKIKYLHDRNVILGDINPSNILVVSPTEVYFVDTDSYQVEGFPCTVGRHEFTAPEILCRNSREYVITQGNENFAVATLLFMIMLPGKTPYAHQGGGDIREDIVKGEFPYPCGEKSARKVPEGPWLYCWSHLPPELKEDFNQTFDKSGEHNSEQTRYGAGYWLKQFENYLNLLKSGELSTQDPMSMNLFPVGLKRNPEITSVQCRICGKEVEEEKTDRGICRDCLKKGDIDQCVGGDDSTKSGKKAATEKTTEEYREDSFNKKNTVYAIIRCSECGEEFEITYEEKEWYDQEDFPLPTLCKGCRERKIYIPYLSAQSIGTPANVGGDNSTESSRKMGDLWANMWD